MSDETALVKKETQLETVSDGYSGTKTVARKADGKFAAKTKVSLKEVTRKTQDFLNGKAEGKDKTRLEQMHEALFEAVLKVKDEPNSLLAAVKVVEALDKMAHGSKTRDRMMEQADPDTNKVRVILVPHPILMNNEPKENITSPTRPSFIEKPKILDAEVISTNER